MMRLCAIAGCGKLAVTTTDAGKTRFHVCADHPVVRCLDPLTETAYRSVIPPSEEEFRAAMAEGKKARDAAVRASRSAYVPGKLRVAERIPPAAVAARKKR